jgi:hypothetical protein
MTIPEMSSTVVAANADGETMAAQRAISQHEMRIQVSMAATRNLRCRVSHRLSRSNAYLGIDLFLPPRGWSRIRKNLFQKAKLGKQGNTDCSVHMLRIDPPTYRHYGFF